VLRICYTTGGHMLPPFKMPPSRVRGPLGFQTRRELCKNGRTDRDADASHARAQDTRRYTDHATRGICSTSRICAMRAMRPKTVASTADAALIYDTRRLLNASRYTAALICRHMPFKIHRPMKVFEQYYYLAEYVCKV